MLSLASFVIGLSPATAILRATASPRGRVALSASPTVAESETVPLATFQAMQSEYQSELGRIRAACTAAEEKVLKLQKELAEGKRPDAPNMKAAIGNEWDQRKIEKAFDAVDEDGNGTLDLDEFRKGYALLNGDAVARVFDAIDDNGDGVLSKEEFRKGFAMLTSDSQLARVERAKAKAAVETAKVEAVKQAARNLAEAQLMDSLSGVTAGQFPAEYQPVRGQQPLRKPPPRPVGMLTKSQRDRSEPTHDLKRMRKNPRLR